MKQALLRLLTRMFARPFFFRATLRLFHLSLRLMGLLNIESFQLSGEASLLRRVLAGQKNPVVLDVGANEGRYAATVMAVNPGTELHALEPHPVTFRRLAEAARIQGFNAHNLGCASIPGRLPLYDYNNGDGTGAGSTHASLSRAAVEREQNHTTSNIEVDLVRLDDFCRANGISRIRLLKIDTEGFELEVLKGTQQLLIDGSIDAVQFEFNEMNVYTRVFMHDFFGQLRGYRLYRLLPNDLLPLGAYLPLEHELFGFQNVVAIRDGVEIAPAR